MLSPATAASSGKLSCGTPLLDRPLHCGHLLKCEGEGWQLEEAEARIAKPPNGP